MLKGIDISQHQGAVNWTKIKSAVDFVMIRSSWGTGFKDAQLDTNAKKARELKIPHGFYHYAYPNQTASPEAEAEWFMQVIVPQDGELLCLDFEENYGDPVGWSLRFLKRVEQLTSGYKPLIYINKNLNDTKDWSSVVKNDNGLWLALWDYNADAPAPKTDWPVVAMRQYSNKENIGGISPVDANVFYGDKETFAKYGFKVAPTPPTPPTDPCAGLKTEVEKLNRELEHDTAIISGLNKEIGELEKENETLRSQNTEAVKEVGELTKTVATRDATIVTLNKTVQTTADERDTAQGALRDANDKLVTVTVERDTIRSEHTEYVQKTKDQLGICESQITEKDNEIKKLKQQVVDGAASNLSALQLLSILLTKLKRLKQLLSILLAKLKRGDK